MQRESDPSKSSQNKKERTILASEQMKPIYEALMGNVSERFFFFPSVLHVLWYTCLSFLLLVVFIESQSDHKQVDHIENNYE